MGIINGPSDGEFVLYMSALLAAYKGPGFFHESFRKVLGFSFPGFLAPFSDYPILYALIMFTGPGMVITVLEK